MTMVLLRIGQQCKTCPVTDVLESTTANRENY